ncbi:Hsp70 family protein [Catenuloplanes atrovinosus]|uniref:Hsp70 protein n=1 Tax=Catenuloplanes atrovinosus TaxID=137266 RepID=A0AAE4CAH2_9ACTN|nr:Hsp70 family protein [Catenuloplanes atrovinosus]MDR7275819.1 hypothetical protein [Catenuloplanes atrovinosus]
MSDVTAVRLGIDLGTSHTVAMLAVEGRPPTPLIFDGSPLLPSGVWADPSGRLIVGRDALHAAQTDPAGFEPHPKRHIDEETMLLGAAQPATEAVIAAVLGHVAAEARRVAGRPVTAVVLTHPAAWAARRRQRLESAARTVFPEVTLVPEPIAAAGYVVHRAAARIPPGGRVVIYDFGAGTFDVSVVQAAPHGPRVVASEGLDDTGGTDVDAAVVELLARTYARRDPAAWQRLAAPVTRADRRARRTLWEGARTAKEVLSRTTSTVLHVPIVDEEAPLGREQLDQAARPILERTLVATRRVVAGAGGGAPAGVFLVGGASRVPLAASLLFQTLGVRPTLLDQPELVVAEGALYAAAGGPWAPPPPPAPGTAGPPGGRVPAAPVSGGTAPPVSAPSAPAAGGAGLSRQRAVTVTVAATGVLLVVLVASLGVHAAVRGGWPLPADPSPTPSISPGLDPCVVGVWKQRKYVIENTIDGVPTDFTGYDTGIDTYRADGTYEVVYTGSPFRATVLGDRWEHIVDGRITGHYRTADGELTASGTVATGTSRLLVNGEVDTSGSLTASADPSRYECRGDTLLIHGEFYGAELIRTGETP